MRIFYLSAGWLALALGILGLFLPLLPTTPFVLLAAFCFSKGSPAAHRWLTEHPRLGPILRHWREHRAIPRRAKILATVLMLPLFAKALLFSSWSLAVNAGLVLFGLAVLTFLWSRPSPPSLAKRPN